MVLSARTYPMQASEDFGDVSARRRRRPPGLRNPDYDFPDAPIAIGARAPMRTLPEIRE